MKERPVGWVVGKHATEEEAKWVEEIAMSIWQDANPGKDVQSVRRQERFGEGWTGMVWEVKGK